MRSTQEIRRKKLGRLGHEIFLTSFEKWHNPTKMHIDKDICDLLVMGTKERDVR